MKDERRYDFLNVSYAHKAASLLAKIQ